MIDWLKRLLAGRELDELERWRIHWGETKKYLSQFPDAADALDYLRTRADGFEQVPDLMEIRQRLQERHSWRAETRPVETDEIMLAVLNAAMGQRGGEGVMFSTVVADCHACAKDLIRGGVYPSIRMILCPECGNKRCPKASDHRLNCTGSNEPGQPGSVY